MTHPHEFVLPLFVLRSWVMPPTLHTHTHSHTDALPFTVSTSINCDYHQWCTNHKSEAYAQRAIRCKVLCCMVTLQTS